MLIQDNGEYTGGISGGCIEGNALKKAHLAISGNKATRVTYDTSKDDEAEIGVSLGCNGVITVLIAPVNTNDLHNPIAQLKACSDAREPNLLITVLEAKGKIAVIAGQVIKYNSAEDLDDLVDDADQNAFIGDVDRVMDSGKSEIKAYQSCKLFLEFIPPSLQIIIMGGNYDVYPLLKVTDNMGWQSVVIANPKRLSRNIHQLANRVLTDFNDVTVDKYSVGIIMSHDYNADLRNLEKALNSGLSYIGLLGPASRKKDMLADIPFNIDERHEARIFGPAGLDIGAAQPEEIAISIVAEILSVMRQRPGTSLKERQGPIYDR